MQKSIQTVLLTVLQNLGLSYYSSLPSGDDASSLGFGILGLSFDSDADISDIRHAQVRIAGEGARCSNLYCVIGNRVLEPQKAV
jgi:hypothetical protein